MSYVESDKEEGLFRRNLPWRHDDLNELIHRCDESVSLIRKYGLYLLDQNHQTAINSNNFNPARVGLF